MAQEQMKRSPEKDIKSGGGSISISSDSNKDNGRGGGGGGGFKFNAQASEFVPRSYTTSSSYGNHQMLSTGYFYPCVQFLQDGDHVMGTPSTDWYYVEYLFSDLSLMANDTMAKHVSKDPEGYVPIPVIASMKKIKALVTDHQMLVQALRSSTKLCRTVMVENLPDDHSYQNLEKIFSVVGSVKAIRLCHPPEANPSRSKNEAIISNKLHALVEYENAEFAEKAAEKLNDERDWRKGLRVRVMQRRTPKSILKTRKSDFDLLTDDDESTHGESPKEISQPNGSELVKDNSLGEESSGVPKKLASPRGRAKTKGRAVQSLNDRGLLSSPIHSIGVSRCDTLRTKLINKGPRMPDGTRGFTMGRGKPIITSSTPSSPVG
uniref:Uncharacterized protein n=1 Tax=Chenopodium quinoa TaxID=63459 RepID=A0A803LE21_CHEQI